MAEVLGRNGQTATLPMMKKGGRAGQATVSIRMDEVEHQHDLVTLKLRAVHVRSRQGPGLNVVYSLSCVHTLHHDENTQQCERSTVPRPTYNRDDPSRGGLV